MIVVSGYRRTGTSAMMEALFRGLLQLTILAYSDEDDNMRNVEIDGYSPNPGLLYEVGGHVRNASFLRIQPEGVLIKIFFDSVVNLPSGEHTVIFMERDESEIRDSLERVQEHFDKIGHKANMGDTPERTFDIFREYDQDDIDHVIGILEQRKDIKLIRVNYRDLVEHPKREFRRIAEHLDLDIEKAASVIDERYYRSRANGSHRGRRDEGLCAHG